ncbi:MAG: hypothetical protein MK212_00100 [Saprospiraceae bacterium]|nr:hypothetical protein [Saprospiraceae bacterium]
MIVLFIIALLISIVVLYGWFFTLKNILKQNDIKKNTFKIIVLSLGVFLITGVVYVAGVWIFKGEFVRCIVLNKCTGSRLPEGYLVKYSYEGKEYTECNKSTREALAIGGCYWIKINPLLPSLGKISTKCENKNGD